MRAEGILDGGLGFFPGQARSALGGFPAFLEFAFQLVVPIAVRIAGARLRAVAVSGTVVVESFVAGTIGRIVESGSKIPVARFIRAVGAVGPVPGVTNGAACFGPVQGGGAACAVPFA